MVKKLFIDTSVFIKFARTGGGPLDAIFDLAAENKIEPCISTVVIFELWSGKSMKTKDEENKLQELIKGMQCYDLTEDIAKKAGELRRKGLVTGFDTIIAATAIIHKAQLATLNVKHFEKIKGLSLI